MAARPADNVYDDILQKYRGDHRQAQNAMRNLGLEDTIPGWAHNGAAERRLPHYEPADSFEEDARQRHQAQQGAMPSAPPHSTPAFAGEGATRGTTPAGFRCPLTGIIMRAPYLLRDSGISAECAALEWSLHVSPGKCPVTGIVLTSGAMEPDEDLKHRIEEWAAQEQPDLLDRSGCLRPYRFDQGIDRAIRDHKRASAHSEDLPVNGGYNGLQPAQSIQPMASQRISWQPPLEGGESMHTVSNEQRGSNRWGGPSAFAPPPYAGSMPGRRESSGARATAAAAPPSTAPGSPRMYTQHDDDANDLDFAHRVAQSASGNRFYSTKPIVVASHLPADHHLWELLQKRLRRHRRAYALCGLAYGVVLLAGFLVPFGVNEWSLADISGNPWLGVGQAAMRDAGAQCTSCMLKDDEWWRLLTSLIIVAGVAQALFNGLMFSAAALAAHRGGLPVWAFVLCTSTGAVLGSLTSAAAAQRTIHSTSTAIPAAAAAAAVTAVLSLHSFLKAWKVTVLGMVVWLALLIVASLAPFADTWATVAAIIGGALCSAAAMGPFIIRRSSKGMERLLILWQLLLALFVVALTAGVIIALVTMPRTGRDCTICDNISCQSFLGWNCGASYDDSGYCRVLVFPDGRVRLECPGGGQVNLPSGQSLDDIDSVCEERCAAQRAPAQSQSGAPSTA